MGAVFGGSRAARLTWLGRATSLYVELRDGAPTLFKLVLSHSTRSRPGAVAEGEELELVDEDALEGLTLEDLPLDVIAEYLGNLEDGRRVLVTRPSGDITYEDFRVFLGKKDAMVEHPVESVQRQRDGGSTTIVFTLDGESATLDFSVVMVDGRFMRGPAMLTLADGTIIPIDLLDPTPDAIAQHTYVCAN